MALVTKVPRDDPIVQQEDKVPLWRTLFLSLHCTEKPASTIVPVFKTVSLGKEVLGIEILLFLWK